MQCLFVYMQHMSYYVLIARFMPRVEIVQKQNSTVRRIYIQGHNGKVSSIRIMLWGAPIQSLMQRSPPLRFIIHLIPHPSPQFSLEQYKLLE